MENKVKVDVKILHYVNGQNIQDIGDVEAFLDIEPFYIDEKLLNGQILSLASINDYCSAVDSYCRKVAGNMIPYETDYEGYLLQFYYNDEMISSALLNNYSDFFGCELDLEDLEIAE